MTEQPTHLKALLARHWTFKRPRLAWWWAIPGVAVAIVLYYAIGAFVVHRIDANPNFGPGAVDARHSRAVAVAAALVFREVDAHTWSSNAPFFHPAWMLADMPHYQQGIIGALARFTASFAERNEAGVGGYLNHSAGLLKYPPTVWRFDLSPSLMPKTSADRQYRRAARGMQSYNDELAGGRAVFDRSASGLAQLLDDIGSDLDQVASVIGDRVEDPDAGTFDSRQKALFYSTKGRLYAYSLVLRELGEDFATVLGQRQMETAYRRMTESFAAASAMAPMVIINGGRDSIILPSHLATQGFYLVRARQQLSEAARALKE